MKVYIEIEGKMKDRIDEEGPLSYNIHEIKNELKRVLEEELYLRVGIITFGI